MGNGINFLKLIKQETLKIQKMKITKMTFLYLAKMLLVMTTAMVSCSNSEDNDKTPEPDPNPIVDEYLPDWQDGFLDIHHIATGRGDVTFIVYPDGTTMLIDAGDRGTAYGSSGTPALPDNSKTPGEWIVDYINHFSAKTKNPGTLDYTLVTHFHSDHIGNPGTAINGSNNYKLSGITMVGEHIPMAKIVDRGWPDYSFPTRKATEESAGGFWNDYLAFLVYQKANKGTSIEQFAVGSNTQFVLKNNPSLYPGFKVQNLYSNGEIWTGQGTAKKTLYLANANPDENMNSCAIKLTYGRFSYFSGGDLSGHNHAQYISKERNIEGALAPIIGRMTILKANHHGWVDSTNPVFLQCLRPEAIIILANHIEHPHASTLAKMVDPLVYQGNRSYFITCLSNGQKSKLGSAANVFKPAGHIVIRAYAGGSKYRTYVLDATSESYPVLYQSEEMEPGN